jgi:hypothetical protein
MQSIIDGFMSLHIVVRLICTSVFLFFGLGSVAWSFILSMMFRDSLDNMRPAERKETWDKMMSGDWKDE